MNGKHNIISVQSRVVYGYVGNNMAEFAMQIHGFDPIAFPTVIFSAHSGHQPIHGTAIDKELFLDLIQGIKEIGVIKDAACMMSGYMKDKDVISIVSTLVRDVKEQNNDIVYICDPVMGDTDRGLYVAPETAKTVIETLIPLGDIITPNLFEINYILGCDIRDFEELTEKVHGCEFLAGKTTIVTSCVFDDSTSDFIDTIIITPEDSHRVKSSRIPTETTGTGDLFTSVLSSRIAAGSSIEDAVVYTTDFISRTLEYMHSNGLPEPTAKCILHARGIAF